MFRRPRLVWSSLAAIASAALVLVSLPLVILWPLFDQPAALLRLAYLARAHGVALTLALLTGFVAVAVRGWSTVRPRPGLLAALLLPVLASVGLKTVNVAELIFAPADGARMVPVAEGQDIADSDMVLGVSIAGAARAYPVRYLAFHHMINDRLGGVPILPTY